MKKKQKPIVLGNSHWKAHLNILFRVPRDILSKNGMSQIFNIRAIAISSRYKKS